MVYKNKVAVLGVIFPGVEDFLDEYLLSLQEQTFKDFDLVIINDGFKNFYNFKNKYQINIKEVRYKNTPAKIREFGINYIRKQGYDYIIFTDSDDFFSINRVEKSIELLRHYDVVVNDLTTVTRDSKVSDALYISNRLPNLSFVNLNYIVDKNIFGFSNTSIRLRCLKGEISFEENLIAVDWYLFSSLLCEDCTAIFTNETLTFYRIYERNTVGLTSDINRLKVNNSINIKILQYEKLSNNNNRFKHMHLRFKELKKRLADDEYGKAYIERIKRLNIKKPLWWEEAKLPEQLDL